MLGIISTVVTPLQNDISVVVVFAFFFCWSPFHSQRLMFVLVTLYGSWTGTLTSAQHILFVISGTTLDLFCLLYECNRKVKSDIVQP